MIDSIGGVAPNANRCGEAAALRRRERPAPPAALASSAAAAESPPCSAAPPELPLKKAGLLCSGASASLSWPPCVRAETAPPFRRIPGLPILSAWLASGRLGAADQITPGPKQHHSPGGVQDRDGQHGPGLQPQGPGPLLDGQRPAAQGAPTRWSARRAAVADLCGGASDRHSISGFWEYFLMTWRGKEMDSGERKE